MAYCLQQVFTIVVIFCCGIKAQSYNDTKTLVQDLMLTYNSKIRPVQDQAAVLNITMTFYLSSIISFNEQEESLSTAGYLRIFWDDVGLTWTSSQYNNIYYTFIPQDDIWKPDISLRNSFETFSGLGASYQNAFVTSDGEVTWEPFQIMKSTCSVDITYFPYDTQTCTIKYIAWSYTKAEINMLSHSGIIKDDYSESSTWDLVKSTVEASNDFDASITYTLVLERKPRFYVFNVILPVILLSLLNMCTFILPLSSGERASYSITVFLSLVVYLTIVASEFPKNSDTTSLLAVYLILMVSLSTLYVILTIFESRLYSRDDEKQPAGKYYRKLYRVALFLQCKTCGGQVRRERKVAASKESLPPSITDEESDHEVKWADVTDAMDYVFFWGGIFLTVLVTMVVLLMLRFNPDRVTGGYTTEEF